MNLNIINFMIRAFEITANTQASPRKVYPFLDNNLDKLNDDLIDYLEYFFNKARKELSQETLQVLAASIYGFGKLVKDYPKGQKEVNQSIALKCLLIFHSFFNAYKLNNPTADNVVLVEPVILVEIGLIYLELIRGKKTENLEEAIRYLKDGLNLFKAQEKQNKVDREMMMMAKSFIGVAYCQRILGVKEDNIEKAILFLKEAEEELKILKNGYPNNISNICQTINKFLLSHKFISNSTLNKYNHDWRAGEIYNNLGNAYGQRIIPEREENIEKAIYYYLKAREIYNNCRSIYNPRKTSILFFNEKDYIKELVQISINLGVALYERRRGTDNLNNSIKCFEEALNALPKDKYPQEWALLHNNLGNAYCDKVDGDRKENIKTAINHFKDALQVYNKDKYPYDWAKTYNNLGNAYCDTVDGDRKENIERAIDCFKAALQERKKKDYPYEWGVTTYNRGRAYYKLFKQDKKNSTCQLAIKDFKDALQVRQRNVFPLDYIRTQYNLGLAYQDSGELWKAYRAYSTAIHTIESLREEINLGLGIEEDKIILAEKSISIYQHIVGLCLQLGYADKAIEYVERSKTRNLVELLENKDLYPNEKPYEKLYSNLDQYKTHCKKLDNGRRELAKIRREIQGLFHQASLIEYWRLKPDNFDYHKKVYNLRTELENGLQALNGVVKEINKIDTDFQLTQKNKPIRFREIKNILDDNTAIVEWFIAKDELFTFIINSHQGKPKSLRFSSLSLFTWADRYLSLFDWSHKYLDYYHKHNKIAEKRQLEQKLNRQTLNPQLNDLANILHLKEILESIEHLNCNRIILIPHCLLHLFPLHALPLPAQPSQCLLDKFKGGVGYAPSCQLLQLAQTRERQDFTHLFAIQNPTKDETIQYADLAVEAISHYFKSVNILKHETATLEAINKADNPKAIYCAHFSCHGVYHPINPRKSALILADSRLNDTPAHPETERYLKCEDETYDLDKCLTLDAIFSLNLEQCRLVTLSACETGLVDWKNISDEYISLPSGFIYAGSPSVVGSLWRVKDVSAALLMIKFYQNLKSGLTVALALNQAQIWLRDATTEQLQDWVAQLPNAAHKIQFMRHFTDKDSNSKPFESPYHWAAFCAIGE